MNDLVPLLLLYLIAQSGKRRGWPAPAHHEDPHSFPQGGLTPASYHPGKTAPASAWTPYKPLTAEVIARAQQLLSSGAVETIEPDPSHPGDSVRYLRTHDTHTGKTNVTAWRSTHPNLVRT